MSGRKSLRFSVNLEKKDLIQGGFKMDFAAITNYFAEYGLLFLFLIILLEYM